MYECVCLTVPYDRQISPNIASKCHCGLSGPRTQYAALFLYVYVPRLLNYRTVFRALPLLVSLPLHLLCLLYVYVCRPLLRLQNIRWLVFVFAWLNLFDVAIRRILMKQKTHQTADIVRCVKSVIDMPLTSSLTALSLISFVCALRWRGG